VYLDDIAVFSFEYEDHLTKLRKFLERMEKHNLTLNPSKCVFANTVIQILGHIVDEDGIRMDPAKVESIKKFPTPRNVTDVH